MEDNELESGVPLVLKSEHESFETSLHDGFKNNQIYVVLKLLEQLQLSLPDKSTVQSTFNLITQILPALSNVASKENLADLSRRIGTIEDHVGKISRTCALNDKDVQNLKEEIKQSQIAIREAIKIEIKNVESASEERKRDLDRRFELLNHDFVAIRTESDKEIRLLKDGLKESQASTKQLLKDETGRLEKASDDRKRDLDRQLEASNSEIKAVRAAVDALVREIGAVRAENGRYLLGTIISIILFVTTVSMFFLKPIFDASSHNVSQGVQTTSTNHSANPPVAPPSQSGSNP